jgi:predicted HAD superfamily phosphohydrolase
MKIKPKVVRVTATEFELSDGRVYQHPVQLDDVPTPEEFQDIEWLEDVLPKSYESELVEDMVSLMSSFSARVYGKRSAENKRKKKALAAETPE